MPPLLPAENPFELLVNALGLGARVNHFSFYTAASQTQERSIGNERHMLLYLAATMQTLAANLFPDVQADLFNFAWSIRHNNRMIVRNRGTSAILGTSGLLAVVNSARVSVAYEGTSAGCVATMSARLPIMETVDGGTLEYGLISTTALSWGRSIDLVTLDVTGLAKAFPRSRRR